MSRAKLPIRFDFYKLLLMQSAVVVVIALSLFLFHSVTVAGSFLLGGLVCILPSMWLMRRLLAIWSAPAKRILQTFFWGEAVKLFLVAVLFIVFLRWHIVTPASLLAGFIVAQLAVWLAPLVLTPSCQVAS